MSAQVILAFVSVAAVSLISLAGLLTLSMSEVRVRRLATFFVSFAVGAILTGARGGQRPRRCDSAA